MISLIAILTCAMAQQPGIKIAVEDSADAWSSFSGAYLLLSEPIASGESQLSLRRQGVEVWSRRPGFRLENASVSSSGVVFGYTSLETIAGTKPMNSYSVMILGADGQTRAVHKEEVDDIDALTGVFTVGPSIVVRTMTHAGEEQWRLYDLQTCAPKRKIIPTASLPAGIKIVDAKPVGEFPLALLLCTRDKRSLLGSSLFVLDVDHSAAVVWQRDYSEESLEVSYPQICADGSEVQFSYCLNRLDGTQVGSRLFWAIVAGDGTWLITS